jgi:hypothetical protein
MSDRGDGLMMLSFDVAAVETVERTVWRHLPNHLPVTFRTCRGVQGIDINGELI